VYILTVRSLKVTGTATELCGPGTTRVSCTAERYGVDLSSSQETVTRVTTADLPDFLRQLSSVTAIFGIDCYTQVYWSQKLPCNRSRTPPSPNSLAIP
jgi:hypothetical protein